MSRPARWNGWDKMNGLKELLKFLLGFMPWILFLFLSGHTLAGLERSIVICIVASLTFGFRELSKGFLLQWGTLFFFVFCAVTVNLMKLVAVAENMGTLANGFLAALIWITVLTGRPFTLQYARADLPKERWSDPRLVRACRLIAIVWALLLTLSASVSYFRTLFPGLFSDRVYLDISLGVILGGIVFTFGYKKLERDKHKNTAPFKKLNQ